MKKANSEKIFLVINLSFFGDVLLTNSLCQNIKLNYPDSKVVFLVNEPFYEAAKNQVGVDDVLVFDKRHKNKGLLGLLKFVFSCPYKNKIYASFVMYDNDRGNLISFLLGAKIRVAGGVNISKFLVNKKHSHDDLPSIHAQDTNGDFIRALTGKDAEVLPIKYITNPSVDVFACSLASKYKGKDIIGLCTVSKNKEKDMPVDTAIEIINKYNKEGKVVFFFGAGKDCVDYVNELHKRGCTDFENLVNATSISSLANIMKLCKVVISVDTGTMHLACAVGAPIAVVFYKPDMIEKWAPREFLYKSIVIKDNYSTQNICMMAEKLVNMEKTKVIL